MVNFKTLTALTAALLLSFAAAHATVKSDTRTSGSKSGADETYRLQVPVEKDMATTQVLLVVPAGLKTGTFMPVPGFARAVKTDINGMISEVTWEVRIQTLEVQRVLFSAQNPADAGTLLWKVSPTCADGTVVSWDDSDPSNPASRVTVK